MIRQILGRKAARRDAAVLNGVHERIRHVLRTVIAARGDEVRAFHADLALLDCDVDVAQIRTVLIRPEDRLRPRVADVLLLVLR